MSSAQTKSAIVEAAEARFAELIGGDVRTFRSEWAKGFQSDFRFTAQNVSVLRKVTPAEARWQVLITTRDESGYEHKFQVFLHIDRWTRLSMRVPHASVVAPTRELDLHLIDVPGCPPMSLKVGSIDTLVLKMVLELAVVFDRILVALKERAEAQIKAIAEDRDAQVQTIGADVRILVCSGRVMRPIDELWDEKTPDQTAAPKDQEETP